MVHKHVYITSINGLGGEKKTTCNKRSRGVARESHSRRWYCSDGRLPFCPELVPGMAPRLRRASNNDRDDSRGSTREGWKVRCSHLQLLDGLISSSALVTVSPGNEILDRLEQIYLAF
jgi:hypothetical protein